VKYELAIETTNPLVVRNNLLNLRADANLKLIGSYYQPVITGQVKADEGAQIHVQGRLFTFERGELTFLNEARIEPTLNLQAHTKVGSYDIALNISGTPGDMQTNWSSTPQLSESDVYSVLLTGKPSDRTTSAEMAQVQAVALLSDEVGSRVTQGLGRFLGGNTRVRVEPNLIASETDPGTRLTIGQDFTSNLRATYSMNLADSNDQIWIVEYTLRGRLNVNAVKQSDNTYRGELRHDVRFGGGPLTGEPKRAAAGVKTRVGSVSVRGNRLFSDAELLKRLKIKTQSQYDFLTVQNGADRLRKFYRDRSYLEVKIRPEVSMRGSIADVVVEVEEGAPTEIQVLGFNAPGGLTKQIKADWSNGLFGAQREAEVVQALRNYLLERGWLESKVESAVSGDEKKLVRLTVTPGRHFNRIEIVFRGAEATQSKRLMQALSASGMKDRLQTNPDDTVAYLAGFLHREGYLWATVGRPISELPDLGTDARFVVTVKSGPRAHLGRIEFSGNRALTDPQLRVGLKVRDGMVVGSSLAESLRQAVQEKYWREGYRDVDIAPATKQRDADGTVDLAFQVEERRQTVISSIRVEGNVGTSEAYIRQRLGMKEGDVYDFVKANASRKKFYDTNAFTQMEIAQQPVEAGPGATPSTQKPVDLLLRVREPKPFQIRYGPTYDSDRGPGAIVDFENRNTLGSARTLGARFLYDSLETEQRLYISQPFLREWPVKTTLSASRETQRISAYDGTRLRLTWQEDVTLGKKFNVSAGFTWEHVDVKSNTRSLVYATSYSTSPLFASLTRDTRDDVLDAYHGSFQSVAADYAPRFFPGSMPYYRLFPQFFTYRPLAKAPQYDQPSGRAMPGLLFASAVRIGLSAPIGQTLLPTERFFAGGGTSIRGFEQDTVGPKLPNGSPAGGNAMFVANEELRFPLYRKLTGATFLDVGNVYPAISDFTFRDLRAGAGGGLRFRLGFLLLRFDYGFNLNRRPGEKSGTWFFSLGQMF
jgi:outer membrane protein assembly complex protein YaeT